MKQTPEKDLVWNNLAPGLLLREPEALCRKRPEGGWEHLVIAVLVMVSIGGAARYYGEPWPVVIIGCAVFLGPLLWELLYVERKR